MNRNQIIGVVGLGFAFIFCWMGSGEVWAAEMLSGDTVELRIDAVTVYPGHFKEVRVSMMNPVRINSFQLHFTLGDWFQLINFKTTDIYEDTLRVVLDTCPDPDTVCTVDTCECDEKNYVLQDTCPCLVLDTIIVRECYLDTVGSLISKFKKVSCHGDTLMDSLTTDYITVMAWNYVDSFIEARGDFDLLFKFGVDVHCLSDADTARRVLFFISPETYWSHFVDIQGHFVPFKYDPIGQLWVWWALPGDANNDSAVNVSDVVFLTNYLFIAGAPRPCVMEAADPDSSCSVNVSDVVYLQNYLFLPGSPPPKPGCASGKKEEEE